MTPLARDVIADVAARSGVPVDMLLGKCRHQRLVLARAEVAKELRLCGYTFEQIGRILRRDHTTIIFYLGKGKRHPSIPRWKPPRVRHLKWQPGYSPSEIRKEAARVKKLKGPRLIKNVAKEHRKKYLIPYAGADFTSYVWHPRRAA